MNGFTLSREQRNAATSDEDHLLIIAPPGCGKTEVLAHRAAHQLASLEESQRVLALTFTKRARSNLEERLRSVLGHARARRQILVGNLHGFLTRSSSPTAEPSGWPWKPEAAEDQHHAKGHGGGRRRVRHV